MPDSINTGNYNKRIHSLSGLKVIAMFLIFWWHSNLEKPPVDLGARACEFFFVVAGFLFFYSHKERPVACTVRGIYTYARGKVSSIWPIHFICFLLTLVYIKPEVWMCRDGALLAAMNLSMVHAFVNKAAVYHSFNGVSWFCSSIVFCYVMAPLIARSLRSLRKAPLFFAGLFCLRFMIEWVQTVKPGEYWDVSIHVFPVVRLLEFALGMSCAAAFIMLTQARRRPGFAVCTAMEAAAFVLTIVLMIEKQHTWLRAMFMLPFSLLVFVFAFDQGLMSRLLGLKPFRFFSGLQLEFFIIHQVMFRLIQHIWPVFYGYPKREFVVCLLLTTAAALVYKKFIQKPFSRMVSMGLDWVYGFLAN